MLKSLTLLAALAVSATMSHAQEAKMTDPIYELAIQEVKSGMEAQWAERRAAFLDLLGAHNGNEKDWTFKAFFTFPEPGPNPVYIGITRWSRLTDFGAAAEALMPTPEAKSYFQTVNMQAFVQMSPADGQPFVLEDHINTPGQVIEAAVRRTQTGQDAAYTAARDAFFARVAGQPGYIFHREFVTTDGWQAVLIGWNDQAAFMEALEALSQMPEMGAFFSVADVMAYQAALVE
ncbi:hypothetical protein ACLB6G_04380 [Zhengella sp. ZM62]|uniref:hypothetical protein n=1 Tax=Zhengella sedimenti TaxID=3390035 RepID=UPI003974B4F8